MSCLSRYCSRWKKDERHRKIRNGRNKWGNGDQWRVDFWPKRRILQTLRWVSFFIYYSLLARMMSVGQMYSEPFDRDKEESGKWTCNSGKQGSDPGRGNPVKISYKFYVFILFLIIFILFKFSLHAMASFTYWRSSRDEEGATARRQCLIFAFMVWKPSFLQYTAFK